MNKNGKLCTHCSWLDNVVGRTSYNSNEKNLSWCSTKKLFMLIYVCAEPRGYKKSLLVLNRHHFSHTAMHMQNTMS